MPVRRNIQRCHSDISRVIGVRPQMVSGVSLPAYPNGGARGPGSDRIKLIIRYKVNGSVVHTSETDPQFTHYSGYNPIITTALFNSMALSRDYHNTGNHSVQTEIEIQSDFGFSNWFIGRRWRTSYVLQTCNSTVSNVNGVPNFSVVAGNFQSNVWPQHYEVCTNGATIATSNTCNNSFNLFVAEINQNWQRPERKEAQRWFHNTPNATINLQQFTLGFFSNTNFIAEQGFVMEGGNVTQPNDLQVTGTRFFMIQVGTTAPNWAVATKVIRIINCLVEPGDTNVEMHTTVYDLDEFMDEFPELQEQVQEMIEEFAIVFPNPTENVATFRYSASKGKLLSLQALDQSGNLYPLPSETRLLENFYETPEMDISRLPQGIYTILAEYENSETVEKIRFNKK